MTQFANWFPPLMVGVLFTFVGAAKAYGLMRGIEGGAEKPFRQRLCGS